MSDANAERRSWGETARVYLYPRVLAMGVLGLGAGLPFLLVFSTLTAWLNDAGVDKSEIGFFAWVGITYSVKFIWSPVVDQWSLPLLGRLGQRRGWILAGQLGIAAGLVAMAGFDPARDIWWIALCAVAVAFSSSTQDVALDAFRIENAPTELQGAMSASYIFGYRVGLLVAGAGALYLAQYFGWRQAYYGMALVMALPVLVLLLSREPPQLDREDRGQSRASDERGRSRASATSIADRCTSATPTPDMTPTASLAARLAARLDEAIVQPFADFFRRNGRLALGILFAVAVYRLSDITMGIMANPFYLDLGFSKTEIADIAKVFGFFMTIAGSFLCGALVVKYGIYGPLLLGAVLVASTNLLFAAMAGMAPDLLMLAVVVSADNLSAGIASTAFVAFLSSLTNRQYTATQYALFSSLMTLPGKFFSGFSGMVVEAGGYGTFFVVAALLGIPAIAMALWLMRRRASIAANVAAVH